MNGRDSAPNDPQHNLGLTDREWEIVELAASGLNDSQIAERLSISKATVHNHLMHAYSKAGVSRRLDLALWVQKVISQRSHHVNILRLLSVTFSLV